MPNRTFKAACLLCASSPSLIRDQKGWVSAVLKFKRAAPTQAREKVPATRQVNEMIHSSHSLWTPLSRHAPFRFVVRTADAHLDSALELLFSKNLPRDGRSGMLKIAPKGSIEPSLPPPKKRSRMRKQQQEENSKQASKRT